MSDPVVQKVEAVAKAAEASVASKLAAYIRANGLKAAGFSALVGAVVGHLI